MRLTVSLGFWLAGVSAVVLGGHGWLQLSGERKDLERAAKQELALAATAIGSAIESALRDGQEPDVAALLEQLEIAEPSLDIFVFDSQGRLMNSSIGSLPMSPELLPRVAQVVRVRRLLVEELESGDFIAQTQLQSSAGPSGALMLVRSARSLREDFASERRALVFSIVTLSATLALCIVVVLHLRLHRPLKQLVTSIRRLASGDLAARAELAGKDEIAELGREFDAMAAALQGAARDLALESERRETLESGLQNANKTILVGELAAMLAHEIGSPLQVLNGRARALLNGRELPAEARRSAEILVEQTDRIARIVRDMLDVAGRRSPRFDDLDLREPVRAVLDLISPQARRSNVAVRAELHPVPPVRVDAHQVQQVVLNLLQNALRACPGGGKVRVLVAEDSFSPSVGGQMVRAVSIQVDDDGVGVPEHLVAKIFEPFVTNWEHESGTPGTGLGLCVVRSIVSEHGGVVHVGPGSGGVGARFTVYFPASEVARSETASESR